MYLHFTAFATAGLLLSITLLRIYLPKEINRKDYRLVKHTNAHKSLTAATQNSQISSFR